VREIETRKHLPAEGLYDYEVEIVLDWELHALWSAQDGSP
jgi:hypothetical protein